MKAWNLAAHSSGNRFVPYAPCKKKLPRCGYVIRSGYVICLRETGDCGFQPESQQFKNQYRFSLFSTSHPLRRPRLHHRCRHNASPGWSPCSLSPSWRFVPLAGDGCSGHRSDHSNQVWGLLAKPDGCGKPAASERDSTSIAGNRNERHSKPDLPCYLPAPQLRV